MSWSQILDITAVLLALPIVFWLGLIVRKWWLARGGATFDCSLRRLGSAVSVQDGAASARGWMLGLGRYAGEDLEWFRAFSFAPHPRYVVPRSSNTVQRRVPVGPERFALLGGQQIIGLEALDGNVELAMSEEALTGFLAWTEAAPPGPPHVTN
jgi:Protein of unknown function (DUF2550)